MDFCRGQGSTYSYGNIFTATGPLADVNPLRYRGYVYDTETTLYYLQSRYYNPGMGRFINADIAISTGQGLTGNNTFAYCGNNPVTRTDAGGYFWDTVFDVVSLCFSIVDVASNPTSVNAWIGLAGDAFDLIPFVSGVGELTRAATTTFEVIDSVHDASRVMDNTGDIIDTAGDVARKTDFYVTANGEAIPATLDGFNDNLSKLDYQNGKYVGADSNGPIRIRTNEIHPSDPNFTGVPNPLHTVPHFHIDRRANGRTGKWGKTFTGPMEMFY